MDYWERKIERALAHYRFEYGWILAQCAACSGSGRYDAQGVFACSACGGTGRCRVRGPKAAQDQRQAEELLRARWIRPEMARRYRHYKLKKLLMEM